MYSYDNPVDPAGEFVVAAFVLGVPAYFLFMWLVYPWVERGAVAFWSRYGEAVKRLANTEVPIPPVVFEVCGCVARVASAVRYCVNPAAERRRRLGRYLASLPRHSGLTAYEEYEAEINALPPGPARQALRYNLSRMMPRPSARAIEKARAMRGRSRVPEGLVRCLLRGEKPRMYDVAC